MLNLISELTTRNYGGYQSVLAIHAEGSIEAEKMAMLRAYDPRRAVKMAMDLAGLQTEIHSHNRELASASSER